MYKFWNVNMPNVTTGYGSLFELIAFFFGNFRTFTNYFFLFCRPKNTPNSMVLKWVQKWPTRMNVHSPMNNSGHTMANSTYRWVSTKELPKLARDLLAILVTCKSIIQFYHNYLILLLEFSFVQKYEK